jgi:dTDP-4-amino-4,6-dideoxygalactose transaminase
MKINFIDLAAQQLRLKSEIDAAIAAVLSHGQYILGPEVRQLESQLAGYAGTQYALGCANGTDAILLPLMAWDIGPGDAVFCPSFTYCATAEVIALRGAVPVFIDIEREDYNMCPRSLSREIERVKREGKLTPRAVIVVDLFGRSADYPKIAPIARAQGLKLISDNAQGFGTTRGGKPPSHWADVVTTSFFPAKPLGCYGDGGAVMTSDRALHDVMTSLHVHGSGKDKYDNVRVGLNSRLDTLQAAILLAKLAVFDDEIDMRNRIAARYIQGLKDFASRVPLLDNAVRSTWAQFVIEVEDPDGLQAALRTKDIPSARYYPRPIHKQTAYAGFAPPSGTLIQTEACMSKVIALPMSADLTASTQDYIIEAVKAYQS